MSVNEVVARRLTDEQARAIRSRYRDGETGVVLAEQFGVSRATVSLVVNGKRYRDSYDPVRDRPEPRVRTHCKRGHAYDEARPRCRLCDRLRWKASAERHRKQPTRPWMVGIPRASNGSFLPGWGKPGLARTVKPTTRDIAWAAGIYEGEGYATLKHPKRAGWTEQVAVGQKDPWILHRLRELFGGTVSRKPGHCNGLYTWAISGARARGFAMTIYTFLSPRRRAQIVKVLRPEEHHEPE